MDRQFPSVSVIVPSYNSEDENENFHYHSCL